MSVPAAQQRVWCDVTSGGSKGATKDTYDTIGTVTIKKSQEAAKKHIILGFLVGIAATIVSSGISSVPILRVNSKDLGITNQDFTLANCLQGDGIATNDKEVPVSTVFIPFQADPNKSTDNAKIDFTLSSPTNFTTGWDVVVGVLYSNFVPDEEFRNELKTMSVKAAAIGARDEGEAAIKTTGATAFTQGILITSDAKQLVGLLSMLNVNAPTAGESAVGHTEFQAASIPDFQPQKWPFCINWSGGIGTPVGQANVGKGFYYPTRFDLPEVNFTMSVSQSMVVALTNEGDGEAGILARN